MKPYEFQKALYAGGHGLTPTQVAICGYLAWLAVKDGQPRHGYVIEVPQKNIATAAGVRRQWVSEMVADLAAKGWLRVEKVVSGGRYATSRYRLTAPDHVALADTDHVALADSTYVALADNDVVEEVGGDGGPITGGADNLKGNQTSETAAPAPAQPQGAGPGAADTQPTTPLALALANGWPPWLTAAMTTGQRLRASAEQFAGPEQEATA